MRADQRAAGHAALRWADRRDRREGAVAEDRAEVAVRPGAGAAYPDGEADGDVGEVGDGAVTGGHEVIDVGVTLIVASLHACTW